MAQFEKSNHLPFLLAKHFTGLSNLSPLQDLVSAHCNAQNAASRWTALSCAIFKLDFRVLKWEQLFSKHEMYHLLYTLEQLFSQHAQPAAGEDLIHSNE